MDKEPILTREAVVLYEKHSPHRLVSFANRQNRSVEAKMPPFRLIHSDVAFTALRFSRIMGQSNSTAFFQRGNAH